MRDPVHPHVCGEYCKVYPNQEAALRFIPTCVGNTASAHLRPRRLLRFIPTCVGNTIKALSSQFNAARFIPTCVGNTLYDAFCVIFSSVHPHVCGEYAELTCFPFTIPGSSPRVWGILGSAVSANIKISVHPHVCGEYVTVLPASIVEPRFIPTCVGNTVV